MSLRTTAAALCLTLLATAAACSDDGDAADRSTTTAASPADDTTATSPIETTGPGRGEWEVVEPEAVDLDAAVLEELATEAEADGSNCLLVVRDGRIAGEWYWNGTDAHSAQEVFSITKSVTSVLAGIAVADSALSVDDAAAEWIEEWQGTPAEAVTVRDLLSNDSGRAWSFQSDYQGLLGAEDRTGYAVGLEQSDPPGTVWAYNNSAIQTLEQVLAGSTGQPVQQLAQERLLGPLGMDDSMLTTDPSGNALTFMGLQSTCRDLARFGWLIAEDGAWGDDQIVPAAWIEESTGAPSQDLNAAYGYLWWLNRPGRIAGAASPTRLGEDEGATEGQMVPDAPEDLVWALGLGSQIVQVHDATDTVLVRLGPTTTASPYSPAKAARLVTEAITDD